MTKVVYVLLALNLSLLTWNLHSRTATGVAPKPQIHEQASGVVNQLPLLTELPADALRPRATATATATTTAVAATAAAAPNPPGATPGQNAIRAAQGAAEANPVPIAASVGDAAPEAMLTAPVVDANAAAAAVAKADASAAEQPVEQVTVRAPESVSTEAAAKATAVRVCLTLGPLDTGAPIEEMRMWLQQASASVDVRSDERREVALYWVYFPPRTSRQKAIAEVERLRGEGITDVIAVPKGDMANAISLGVFSRTESRDRRVKEMNQRGYQPSVAPRYRVKLASWIDVNAPANALSEEKIRSRWPDLEVSHKPCSELAVEIEPTAAESIAAGPIAPGQEASYNAPSPVPRRFHFSGPAASQPVGTADASR